MTTKIFHASYWELKIRNFRWWLQRGKRGWSECDSWNIDTWFMNVMLPMLTSYRKHHIGYPGFFHSVDEWNEVLDRMIYLLKEMKKDDFTAGGINNIMEAYNYRNDCKNEFFALFSEYFYNLWD